MSSDQPEPTSTVCPRCSAIGTGRFCTECGTPLNGAPCSTCGETLTPGSKFCHHCGAAAGPVAGAVGATGAPLASTSGATMANTLPWAVAAIAFLTLFAMLASKGFNARRGSAVDAPMNALPNPTVDVGAPAASGAPFAAGGAGGAGGAGVRAPDISNLSPTEIANRLFNRVMQLNDEGKSDSVAFFAPMAVQAYQMVEQEQGHPLDADQRYDVGRIGEVAGALQIARAQADTILQQHPDHLLGLILAGQVAKLSGNSAALNEYRATFTRVKARELAKNLPEYKLHSADINAGI